MVQHRLFSLALAVLLVPALIAGCGGGSGGDGSGSGTAGTASVSLYVTDDLTTQYSHVWVTLLKAEVVGPSGAVTLYDDNEGRTIDLTTLSGNGLARFALLAQTQIPAGEYTTAKFTFKNELSLVPTGGTEAVTRTFKAATGDTAVIPLSLTGSLSGKCNLVADFDLKNWTDDGTSVSTVVKRHDGQGLGDKNRQNDNSLHGTVSGLTGTAPAYSFTITRGASTVKVVTDAATAITSHDASTSPTLANGARVEIIGAFDTTLNAVLATSVKVGDDAAQDHGARVEGAASAATESGFTLTVGGCDGFIPKTTTVTVTLTDATVYRSRPGITYTKAEFLAALATATRVEAEGTYDATSKTLTAKSVRIAQGTGGDDGSGHGNNGEHGGNARPIEVRGTASAGDATAGTLTLTAERWQGQSLKPGATLSVATDATTTYRASGDATLTAAEFFAALGATTKIEVRGTLSGTTLAAKRIRVERTSSE